MKTRHVILTLLATLVIFAAGVGTGTRLARTNLVPPPPFRTQPQPGGMPMMWRVDQFARMVRELNLDPMQRQRINRLIAERQEYMADVIRLIDPELQEMMPKLRRDVNELLRPEQRRELERRFMERTERMKGENSGLLPEPRRRLPQRENQLNFRPEGPRPPAANPPPNP